MKYIGPIAALHSLEQSLSKEACEILAEMLELEGDEGLGEFVQDCIRRTRLELTARIRESQAKRARQDASITH